VVVVFLHRQMCCFAEKLVRCVIQAVPFGVLLLSRVEAVCYRSNGVKPALELSFDAYLHLEGVQNSKPISEGRRIQMDRDRGAVAVEPTQKHYRANGSVLLDVGQGLRIQSEPFFGVLICFAFDLWDTREAVADAFMNVASDALAMPLELYEDAQEDADGQCGENVAWTALRHGSVQMPSSEALAALESEPVPSDSFKELQYAQDGALEFALNVTFCVDSAGQLHGGRVSQTVQHIRPEPYSAVLVSNSSVKVTLSDVHVLVSGTSGTLLNPNTTISGGACVDLRSATGEPDLLHESVNEVVRLDRINLEALGGWEADVYSFLQNSSVQDIVQTLGTAMRALRLPLRKLVRRCGNGFLGDCVFASVSQTPVRFDARERWETCSTMQIVRNQGSCGSCWAIAAVTVLADRFCVATAGRNESFRNLSLAPQQLLDCAVGGCDGGRLDIAWLFLRDTGVLEETCNPYTFCDPSNFECEHGSNSARCNVCAAEGPPHVFRAASVYAVGPPGDVLAIQREIARSGPVQVAFFVFSDFHSYRRGTYFRTRSAYGPLGGHAVRLMGWGSDELGTAYWLAANSFGSSWGEGGFFRMKRGTNECGIETMPAAGLPLIP